MTDKEFLKHTLRAFRGLLFLFAVAGVYVFAQSYNGRRVVVDAARKVCHQTIHARVLTANAFRAEEEASTLVAADLREPSKARAARRREVTVLKRTLLGIDLLIDPHYETFVLPHGTRIALNPVGRKIVTNYQREGIAYDCEKTNPAASPWQFLG